VNDQIARNCESYTSAYIPSAKLRNSNALHSVNRLISITDYGNNLITSVNLTILIEKSKPSEQTDDNNRTI
jgi:hypothetical protein